MTMTIIASTVTNTTAARRPEIVRRSSVGTVATLGGSNRRHELWRTAQRRSGVAVLTYG